MSTLYEIAKIVFPDELFVNNKKLFVNHFEEELSIFGSLEKTDIYRFDTWMNLFAAKKYYHYCDMGKIYLKLNVQGRCAVNVIGCNLNLAFNKIEEILATQKVDGETVIEIPNAQNFEAVYFEVITSQKEPCKILGAAWVTDKEPNYDNKLAVVCCTFKRENYISKNIKRFEDFKAENPQLKDKINLFISDNGKTLPESLNSDCVKIYPNMNAGGAGGFTRGLIEVMKLNQGYTRVLFMDDDVEMFPESFYRTLMLSNYLKEEYKNSIINGAMIDLYNKSQFCESVAVQTTNWVRPYHPPVDLNITENVMCVNSTNEKIFNNSAARASSAWWYCSFAIETFEDKGLPLPVFFRCDDIEYSWRTQGLIHIQLNGICVWHAPFAWRVSSVTDCYYSKRNYSMVNFIYNKNFRRQFFKNLRADFKNLAKKYDYNACEIYLKMMSDLLAGADSFKKNPAEQFKEIRAIASKQKYYDCSIEELEAAKNHSTKFKKWRKLVYQLTARGTYCPKFLFKNSEMTQEWRMPATPFILTKRVKIYNLFTGKYCIREFDAKKRRELYKEFWNLYKQLDKNYDRLVCEYKAAFPELTSLEFWNKYLELDRQPLKI